MNPYDLCISNKTINEKQWTITWYVNDLKISHIHHQVASKVIYKIEFEYGAMAVISGNVHTHIGINIELIGDGKVTLHQPTHKQKSIDDFGEDLSVAISSAAQKQLFHVADLEN